jgi:hypothetical protein
LKKRSKKPLQIARRTGATPENSRLPAVSCRLKSFDPAFEDV